MNIIGVKYSDMNNDNMDVKGTVVTVISVTIGVILCCTVLIPQTDLVLDGMSESELSQWGGLIDLVVLMTILGLVVAALYMYTSSR